jgi:hypothetical protein
METQDLDAEGVVKGTVEPIIESVDETVAFGIVHAGPFAELAFGVLVLVLIIFLHGWSMSRISRRFSTQITRLPITANAWRVNLLMGVSVALLALTHLAETLLWAIPIWMSGLIPDLRDSYFFVMETYTTLGDSNIILPEAWRLIGPVIAISGLFTFSWTGSVLVFIVGETGRRHAAEARRAEHDTQPPKDGAAQP